MRRVFIVTGPECSGKTHLSLALANELNAIYFPEYAVEYLNTLNRPYELEDLVIIAQIQQEERRNSAEQNTFHVYDTGSLVLRIWSDEKFNTIPESIEAILSEESAEMYLLCYPDLEWEQDENNLRENPHDRERLFSRYEELLRELQLPYVVIRGHHRLEQALKAIRQ